MSEDAKNAPTSPQAWAKIEADYRAGIKSLRQIGSDHGVTEGAIRKRAKKEDWERDLGEKVRAKAEALVRKEAVRKEVRETNRVPEADIIEANANVVAAVMVAHRKDIGRGRTLAMHLLEELEGQTFNPELMKQLGELMYNPDEKGRDKLNEAYFKTISSSGRISSMKQLADTLKTLVALEREAFNIGVDSNKGPGSLEDWLDTL